MRIKTKPATLTPVQLRHRAEAVVREQERKARSKTDRAKSDANPYRMVHELQVHQVELEMQNTELQETRDRMELLLEKFTDLYDFAPVGYLSVDEQGRILEANLNGAALLGVGRAVLLNRPLPPFVAPANRPDFLKFLKQVFASSQKQLCEALLVRADGTSFWAGIHGTVAISASSPRKWCRMVISDLTPLKEAEETQSRLAAIVEYSDDAIIGKNLNGVVTSWNHGAEQIFGYAAKEMVGKSIQRLIPRNRMDEEAFILGKLKSGKGVQHFETLRQTKDGRVINVSITASPIKDASGKIIGASKIARDISKRKQAQEILLRSEALFAALVAQSPVGVYVVDGGMRLLQINPKAMPVFKNVRPLLGRSFAEIMQIVWPRRVADQIVARFRHTLNTGEAYNSPEFAARRRDTGDLEVYEWQVQRVTLPAGEHGAVCFFSDITARKESEAAQLRAKVLAASNQKLKHEIARRKATEESLRKSEQDQRRLFDQSRLMQEQLRDLSRQVLRAQEEERKRISRELHDVIAQTLTGINLRLSALKSSASTDRKGFSRSIALTQRLVEKSVSLVHDFARELRPAVLDDLGLVPALHTFMKDFTAQTGVRTQLIAFAAVEQLDTSQRTVLFRVAQEALTNVAKHARASRVTVTIQKLPQHIGMTITDNGQSFRATPGLQAGGGKRLGLLGMRERVEMVGGNFAVESAPGKGTSIAAQLPLGKTLRGGGR